MILDNGLFFDICNVEVLALTCDQWNTANFCVNFR